MYKCLTTSILSLVLLLLLSGCAGYRFRNTNNPFDRYDIKHISVPMFVNQSALANVSKSFSEKFLFFLTEFRDLEVTSGESEESDAILMGVVGSPRTLLNTTTTLGSLFTQGPELESSIGDRSKFYVPKQTGVTLSLRLVLIKKKNTDGTSNAIIFDRVIPLNRSFTRIISETSSNDSQGLLNYSKNRFNLNNTINDLSDDAVQQFRDLIINVF